MDSREFNREITHNRRLVASNIGSFEWQRAFNRLNDLLMQQKRNEDSYKTVKNKGDK